MKLLVLIGICICQTVAVPTDVKTKMTTKLVNTIPLSQKSELFYSQDNQQGQTDFMPVPVMQKPILVAPQPQMVIIAQPAYVPQNVLYGGQPSMQQQLLNYFHSNPQAKYQLLYGGYQPQPTVQPYITQSPLSASPISASPIAANPIATSPIGAPTIPGYQIVPGPVFTGGYNQLVPAPSQVNFAQVSPYQSNQVVQPMQLSQVAQLAQMAAQQFSLPIRSTAPIITGLENFTPEQQVQIKAQLSNHLGVPITTASTVPPSTNQYSTQLTTQPTQTMTSSDYMQSQDKNVPQPSSTNYSPSLLYRAQFTKG